MRSADKASRVDAGLQLSKDCMARSRLGRQGKQNEWTGTFPGALTRVLCAGQPTAGAGLTAGRWSRALEGLQGWMGNHSQGVTGEGTQTAGTPC